MTDSNPYIVIRNDGQHPTADSITKLTMPRHEMNTRFATWNQVTGLTPAAA